VVRAALRRLGVVPKPEFAGTGDRRTVVGLVPTGKVRRGATVTVVVARTETQPQDEAKPKPKPKPKAEAPKPPGHGGHLPPGQAKKLHGPGPG
jgi:hypothetical protein